MNYRYLVRLAIGMILLLARSSRAQTTPVLSDIRVAVSSVEKKDGDVSPVASDPVRKVDALKPIEVKSGHFHKQSSSL